jgi:hypothetical protein
MKPVEESHVLDHACPNCGITTFYNFHLFYCRKHDLGDFNEPCTLDDWEKCHFKKRDKNET